MLEHNNSVKETTISLRYNNKFDSEIKMSFSYFKRFIDNIENFYEMAKFHETLVITNVNMNDEDILLRTLSSMTDYVISKIRIKEYQNYWGKNEQ